MISDDENLPIVPPILVTVPFDYPDNSPECSTSRKDYGKCDNVLFQSCHGNQLRE